MANVQCIVLERKSQERIKRKPQGKWAAPRPGILLRWTWRSSNSIWLWSAGQTGSGFGSDGDLLWGLILCKGQSLWHFIHHQVAFFLFSLEVYISHLLLSFEMLEGMLFMQNSWRREAKNVLFRGWLAIFTRSLKIEIDANKRKKKGKVERKWTGKKSWRLKKKHV